MSFAEFTILLILVAAFGPLVVGLADLAAAKWGRR